MELETDHFEPEELHDLGNGANCNAFAIDYIAEINENAVLKVGEAINGQEHCWVYDPDLDVTVDATARQFDDGVEGVWEGEQNPNAHDKGWVESYDDVEAFRDEWYGDYSPFYAY